MKRREGIEKRKGASAEKSSHDSYYKFFSFYSIEAVSIKGSDICSSFQNKQQ